MAAWNTLLQKIESGCATDKARAPHDTDREPALCLTDKARALHVADGFAKTYDVNQYEIVSLFDAPGRTELGGNHTDHQHGHVLCGSVSLDMLAAAAPNGLDVIRICSEGYDPFEVSLSDLSVREVENGTTAALVRGMAAGIAECGKSVGGFDAYIQSAIPAGAGLSSSAAFEILIGTIINHYDCRDELDAVTIAKIAQRAENTYFGKPCGLMDQIGCAVGGAVAVDFADPSAPVVRPVSYDFSQSGHALCIIDTASDHADLTADYAAIRQEMEQIAACFGKRVLRDVPESAFRERIAALRDSCGDRAVLRALHYYNDDRAAQEEADALAAGDFPAFLRLVNASGLSSSLLLQNTWSSSNPQTQPVSLALAIARELLDGSGAVRVHGGGFAGTIQAFVPFEKLDPFRRGMEAVFGSGSCHVLEIRANGGCLLC